MNKSAHILVVDDVPDMVEILSRQLRLEPYKIFKAYSGKESLELLKKNKLDLILMDVNMPEMDGFETIKIIRDTVKEFIPIIIVTASKDDTESITRGFAVGADDYVVIPCNKEELLARIKAMLRIKELHDTLEEKNQKLTEAYKELEKIRTNLTQSEKLAVMGRLVADVAHEINNPLAIIIGGIQLMLSRIDETQTIFKDHLERVLRNAQRCKTILGNILGYGHTVGKKDEVTNISNLIREAIENVSYQYDMNAIEVVLNYPDFASLPELGQGELGLGGSVDLPSRSALAKQGAHRNKGGSATRLGEARVTKRGTNSEQVLAEITGNRSALLSVFINLIRNARQAMGTKGRLTITIEKENKKHLRVEIRDTGIGMSAEQKTKLFKPFISGWKGVEGSGLGLTTSLGIIETHGGTLSAESAGEGQGSTFTIILPCEFKEKK